MTSLITFNLKRKYLNKSTAIKGIIVFLVIGVFMFADKIGAYLQDTNRSLVYLNKDEGCIINDFEELVIEPGIQGSHENRLSCLEDGDWLLKNSTLNDNEIRELENNLFSNKGSNKLIIEENRETGNDYSIHLIIFTIVYFLGLSQSVSSSQRIIEEKLNNMVDTFLTRLGSMKYLLFHVLQGWIYLLVEFIMAKAMFLIWSIIRFYYDSFGGVKEIVINNFDSNISEIVYLDKLLVMLLILFVGVLTIQTITVIYVSKTKRVEEISTTMIPIHLVMVLNYYLCFYMYNGKLLNDSVFGTLKFLPLLNTLLIPMSMLDKELTYYMIGMFGISIMWFVIVMMCGKDKFRKNLLNIKKLRYFNLRS